MVRARPDLHPTELASGSVSIRGGRIGVEDALSVRVGAEPITVGRDASCHLVLSDRRVSAIHASFVATDRGVLVRDCGSKNGIQIGAVRVSEGLLTEACTVVVGGVPLSFEPARAERLELGGDSSLGELYGTTPAMRALFSKIEKIAATPLTVLVQGETGSGKELVARALHARSKRRGPLVVVDCGALAPTLAESTLFGHERGAFTGAVSRRISPFVEARGGTVFLDELGELPLEVQPKLLRALAEARVKPVGASAEQPFDARVIAATRRDLIRAVNSGVFRSDLYFRVAQVTLDVPPLRERLADVPGLVMAMLRSLGVRKPERRVPPAELERLMAHDWPGNVRQLRNAVITAHALAEPGAPIDVASHVGGGEIALAPAAESTQSPDYHAARRAALDRFERAYFARLLAECDGNVSEMARRSGIERTHVRRHLKDHGLLPARARRERG